MTAIKATIKVTWQWCLSEYIRFDNYLDRRQQAALYQGEHRVGSAGKTWVGNLIHVA